MEKEEFQRALEKVFIADRFPAVNARRYSAAITNMLPIGKIVDAVEMLQELKRVAVALHKFGV